MAIDDHVTRLAELRNNLLRVSDLQLLGLSRRQIRARIARRQFFAVHPGVLSRTPPPFDFTTRAAALSLALPLGVLSHTTAASLHRIRRAPRDWLDVTLPSRRARSLVGVHCHYSNHLPECDIIEWIDGIRVTTPARALFELASVLDGPSLRSAVEDARNRQLVTDAELDEVGGRLVGRGRPGSVMFRTVVEPLLGEPASQSGYEVVVEEALVEAGICPVRQHRLRLPNGRMAFLDLALLESKIDIEIDPGTTHATPVAIGADKARDVQVVLAGWQPIRFTDDDVDRRLRSVVGYVRALHNQRRAA